MSGLLQFGAVTALGLAVAYGVKSWIAWIGDIDTAFLIGAPILIAIAGAYDLLDRR